MNGQPNPRYTAAVQVYLEALEPFQPWELEAGTKLALESHKYKRWPKPAEMRAFCFEATKHNRPLSPKQSEAPAIEQRPPISEQERELVCAKIAVREDWERNGKMFAKDERGNFRHSLADLTTEARRRIADRLSQQDKV